MARIDPLRFKHVTIQIGDGETSETFATWCGNTTIAHNYNINTETEDLPDCDDPDAVNFESPLKTSVGESIDFSGVLSPAFDEQLRDLVYADDPVNVRLVFNHGSRKGTLQGPAILTAAGTEFAQRAAGTMSGTLTFTSEPTWTATS